MPLENIQANNQETVESVVKQSDIRAENIEFLTLEEKKLDGEVLTEMEQARFEELKQIREARDKKYTVGGGDDLEAASNAYDRELGRLAA
jgi:hypothetical protein